MALPVRARSRAGDTPQSQRLRQRERPPDLLMTTPESLALLSYPDAMQFFASLRCPMIIDELHSFAAASAAITWPFAWRQRRQPGAAGAGRPVGHGRRSAGHGGEFLAVKDEVEIVQGEPEAQPVTSGIIDARSACRGVVTWAITRCPVYNIIRQHKTSIVFVNTRAQAELVFDRLWRINEENLAIGRHHGSLAVEQRRKVEAAMAAGALRAVVATSSLDLGIDWGDVDLVIQMGAPKGVSRLMQRIGRANHRLDEPSRAMIAPANRFGAGMLAALEAVEARERSTTRSAAAALPRRAGPAHRRLRLRPARSTATSSTRRC